MNITRKAIVGALLFISTLGIGYFFGSYLNSGPVDGNSSIFTTSSNDSALSSELALSKIDPSTLVPEFTDLPNLEDTKYPIPNKKLVDILQTGAVYRESEVIAKSGEIWVTLFEQDNGYVLKNNKVTVHKTRTISFPGDEFDVHLSVDTPGLPIFAVRNIRSIRPGKVTTLYLRPSWQELDRRGLEIGSMGKGYIRKFSLNDKEYVLRQSTGLTRSGDTVCILVLEFDGNSQIIAQNYGDDIGDLLWVGDIDHDGKLDLYFDEANEKGYFGVGLYLSSEADPGKLVKLSATFGTAGC